MILGEWMMCTVMCGILFEFGDWGISGVSSLVCCVWGYRIVATVWSQVRFRIKVRLWFRLQYGFLRN